MKKILILFLLCGLHLPMAVQAALAEEVGEALSGALKEGMDAAMADLSPDLVKALGKEGAEAALAAIKANPAFKDMMKEMESAAKELDGVGGDLLTPAERAAAVKAATTATFQKVFKDFKLKEGESPEDSLARLTKSLKGESGAMRGLILKNMETSAISRVRSEMFSEGASKEAIAARVKQVQTAFKNFRSGTENAFGEFRSVGTTALNTAVDKLGEDTDSALAELGGGQDLKAGQGAAVNGEGKGSLSASAGDETTEEGFFSRMGTRVQQGWQKFRRKADTAADLTKAVNDAQKALESKESELARATGLLRKNAEGEIEVGSSAFSRDESTFLEGDLKKLFKSGSGAKFDESGTEIEATTQSVTKNKDGSFTIKVRPTPKDTKTFTYVVRNPSSEETRIFDSMASKTAKGEDLAGDGTFCISKTGNLRLESKGFGDEFEGNMANLKKQVTSAKEELADVTAQRDKQEFAYQKFNRTVVSFAKGIPDVILSPIKMAGKLWDQLKNLFKHVMEVGKMILQGVFFGIPSMIYQALMQGAQMAALYKQITAPVQLADGFWLQIPSFLIPKSNPNSGTFLYVAVPEGGWEFTSDGTDPFLQTASYYVLYQEGAPWAQTYANSSNSSGIWVNLNTGLIFNDGGIPANPQNPYAYLLQPIQASQVQAVQGQQPTLSVEEFIETIFDNVGAEKTLVSFNQSWKDIDPLSIVPSSISITVSPILKQLFKPLTPKNNSEKSYPAPILTPTLNQFRNGIKNVAGFLPPTAKGTLPTLSFKQFQGTGALNKLLGKPTAAADPDNAVALLKSVATEADALQDAQINVAAVLADFSQTSTGITAALAALETAQTNFTLALNGVNNPGVGVTGMDPEYDLNAFSIYVYETEDTPIAKFLKANSPSPLIPAKDYVIFLDANYTIAPLFQATLQKVPSGVGVIAYDTTKINTNIQYMCSLVTGFTYIYDEKNGGAILLNNHAPDMSIASTAIGTLLQSVALVLYNSSSSNGFIDQVTAMANYATSLAHDGPFYKGQHILTRVDWDTFTTSVAAQEQATQSFTSGLNGQQVSSSSILQYGFGKPVSPITQKNWLDDIYIYQVSGQPPLGAAALAVDTTQHLPCFGTVRGEPVYDYVVPIAQGSSGSYQIMPLGISEAVGAIPLLGFSQVQALVSLVTGNVYDSSYNLLTYPPSAAVNPKDPNPYLITVAKRNPDFNVMAAVPGQPSTSWVVSATTTVQVAAIDNVPLATAFMPTSYNPYNVIVTQALEYSSTNVAVKSQQAVVAQAQAAVATALQPITAQLTAQSLSSESSAAWGQMEEYAKHGETENVEKTFMSSQHLFSYNQLQLLQQWIASMGGQVTLDTVQDMQRVSGSTSASSTPPKHNLSTSQLAKEIHMTFQLFDIWSYLQGQIATQHFARANAVIQKYITGPQYANSQLQQQMFAWVEANVTLNLARTKLSQIAVAQAQINPPQPPFGVPKASDQLLYIPPMYWMSFLNYAYFALTASLNEYPVSFMLPDQQAGSASFNWLNLNASPQVTPLGYSLGQALPQTFVEQIKESFLGWALLQDQPGSVNSIMQAGPFQFTNNLTSNVFLTICPTDCQNNNFFYTAPSVFNQGDLCVLGELPAGLYSSITTALNGTTASTTGSGTGASTTGSQTGGTKATASNKPVSPATPVPLSIPPITLADCNTNDHLGLSFYQVDNTVLINLATGNVWIPTSITRADSEDESNGNSSLSNIACIGQVDTQGVLDIVLQNQYVGTGSGQSLSLSQLYANLQTVNPSLYQRIKNNQVISGAQAQASLSPFYFAGKTLSLCKEQIDDRTFIYAVTDYPGQPYLEANDYWAVVELNADNTFVPTGQQLSPATQYMMSLVSYLVYANNCAQASFATVKTGAQGSAKITLSPMDNFNNFFAAGNVTKGLTSQAFASVASNNSALYNRLLDLVTLSTQSFVNATLIKSQSGTGIVAAPLPTSLTKVTGVHVDNLYQDPVSKKYFVYIPGATAQDPSYCYDFNIGAYPAVVNVDATTASGSVTYPPTPKAPQNANRGVYYTVQLASTSSTSSLSIASSSPLSALTGYPCQAMLVKYGITVDSSGKETLGLPVFNPPLPMTVEDTLLAPGQSSTSGYMTCVINPTLVTGSTAQKAAAAATTDYYYFNSEAQIYLARRTVNTSVPVIIDATTNSTGIQTIWEDYYVDLMTGERYHVNGNPYLMDVTVAYYVSEVKSAANGANSIGAPSLVQNTALDYSNPLFLWGQLDVFGEPTQQSCMYQNLIPTDPNFGYNLYQIRAGSTAFTTWSPSTGGSGTGDTGTLTTYSYQTAADGTVSIVSATNAGQTTAMPAGQSMQQVLMDALDAGQFLLLKSYIMDLNGNLPTPVTKNGTVVSPPIPSSSITVSQTCAQPYSYQVNYTETTAVMGSSGAGGNTPVASQTGVYMTDTFQVPLPINLSGAANSNQPGASSHTYNNPPLDASLQLQLATGIPFCAQIIGSRPYGTQALTSFPGVSGVTTVGVNPTICGILSPIPSTASAGTYIADSGLLGVMFAGAIESAGGQAVSTMGYDSISMTGMTNQYFAYYGAYNNSAVAGAQTLESTGLAATVGSYNFYTSVVQNMTNLYQTTSYPGLYAGNFTQQIAAPQGSTTQYLPSGAPYLSIVSLPGGQVGTTEYTGYQPPTSTATEYLYKYAYSTVSNSVLSELKATVNITGNATGFLHLMSAVDPAHSQNATASNPQKNPAASQIIKNQVGYYTPLQVIKGAPAGRYLYEVMKSVDGQAGYITYPVYAFLNAVAVQPYYVDIVNGTVFQQQTGPNGAEILYPAGYALSGMLLGLISQAIGNATPPSGAAAGQLLIQNPGLIPPATSVKATS